MLIKLLQTENIQNLNYRYFLASNYAFFLGIILHFCFIPIFYYINVPILMYYNFVSTGIFILAFLQNRKGSHTFSTTLVSSEVIIHATLAIYFTGWNSGFFYYLLAIIPLVFYNPVSTNTQKITLAILVTGIYLSLKHYANTHTEAIILSNGIINNLYYMNSFFLIFIIAALTYYFSLASEISENQVHKERDEADIANQSKSIFLANMSHELRTPLNAIIGYSEILKEEADEHGRDKNSSDLVKIKNAGNHLLTLINSILDLSKIEAGKIEFEYLMNDINDLINDVITTISPLVKNNNNTLSVNCDKNIGSIYIDQTKLKQALFNLLSNACKFTKNGQIELNIKRTNDENNNWIYFAVSDTGIGIPEEKISHLFQPFIQIDTSTTRLYGGSGLGLTISKHFITLMGGAIKVTSTLGEGTVFTISLPANA